MPVASRSAARTPHHLHRVLFKQKIVESLDISNSTIDKSRVSFEWHTLRGGVASHLRSGLRAVILALDGPLKEGLMHDYGVRRATARYPTLGLPCRRDGRARRAVITRHA